MKHFLVVILCLSVVVSCKKDITHNESNEMNGRWELRVTDGGFSYQHKTYVAGNGNTITFSGSNQYSMTNVIDGEGNTTSGTYSIADGNTCYSDDVTFITFSDTDTMGSILSVSGDSLYIKTNTCVVADGVDRTYVKIK